MNTLQVAADSPWILHAAAAVILWAHIAGGAIGLLAGAAALGLRKGSRGHMLAGHAFFVAMLAMAGVGATVSPFLVSAQGDPRWFDTLAGTFAFYLVATGWATVRRRPGTVGRFEIAAMLFALLAAAAATGLGLEAARRPHGVLADFSASGYYIFAGLFVLAAAFDLKVIRQGGITGAPRLARHLWRMCAALLLAAGAFFLGQQRVMPEFVQGSPLLFIPPLAVLATMVFWVLKLRLAKVINRVKRKRRLRRQQETAMEVA